MAEATRPARTGSRRMSIAVSPSHQVAVHAPQPPSAGGERRHSNVGSGMVATVAAAALKHHAVLRRSLSGLRSSRDLRFEVFVSMAAKPLAVPSSASPPSATVERHRLMVHRTMTLVSLQALIQRELGVPFQDQQLLLFGDELEGDDELHAYGIQSQSELALKMCKRHRRISDVFARIKTIQFPTKSSIPEDYTVVEVVAPLPALPVVFRRIVLVISYLTTLDRLQARRTHRRVWRADPFGRIDELPDGDEASTRSDGSQPPQAASSPHGRCGLPASPLSSPDRRSPRRQEAPSLPPPSFVSQQATVDQRLVVTGGPSQLALQLRVQQHLKVPPELRATSAARQIRHWLATLKYFVDAQVPDAVLHEVARAATYASFQPGDFIFRQGDPGDFFYVLISGSVALAAYGNGYFATMTPGACFGEISLLEARSLRSASATVAFAAPMAELAIVPGDVYRRFINPFKQAVLRTNEHALFSVVQLRALPPTALTHLAYGIKVWSVRPGKRLIRRGEAVKVLVLLVKGAVKVSSAKQQEPQQHQPLATPAAGSPKLGSKRSSLSDAHAPPPYRIVSVVNGPAVFGQEGALSNSSAPAPWDVEAIDTCSLVCLRPDTVSIFLSPCHEVVRALLAEHRARIRQFEQRFAAFHTHHGGHHLHHHGRGSSRRLLLAKKKSSLHLLKPPPAPETAGSGAPVRTIDRVAFPKILLKDDDDTGEPIASVSNSCDARDKHTPSTATPAVLSTRRPQPTTPRDATAAPRRPYTSPDSFLLSSRCASRQDEFLHRALPFAPILSLQEQIRFASFSQQVAPTADAQARVGALLDGLRRLPHEDVRLAPPHSASATRDGHDDGGAHYHFSAVSSR